MQIDSLRYFAELARVGSFYGAAKSAFISQQGLNKAISSLESELGVKLVEREKRGVRLTSSGEVFLEHAKTLLEEYSETLKDLYAEHATASGDDARLVIHMTYYPSQISEPFVRSMKETNSVSFVEEPFKQLIKGARESDGSELFLCDIFGELSRITEDSNLAFEPVIVSQVGLIWQDKSPIRPRKTVHREQLADVPITVDTNREMVRAMEYIMEDYPMNNIRMGVANPKSRIEYLAKSEDIVAIYDSFGYTLIQANPQLANSKLHFTPFSTPRSFTRVGFLYNKKARPSTRARHIIDLLHQHTRVHFADYLERYPL